MEHLHYSYVLIFISICAIGVNFGFRLQFSKKLKLFLLTDSLILVVYLIWDFWAISKGSWFFDASQILGVMLLGKLPIEEFLFFIIVPLMTVLTYLALIKLTGWQKLTDEGKDKERAVPEDDADAKEVFHALFSVIGPTEDGGVSEEDEGDGDDEAAVGKRLFKGVEGERGSVEGCAVSSVLSEEA